MEWTHRICERCWFGGVTMMVVDQDGEGYEVVNLETPPGMTEDGTYRMPVQVLGEDGRPEPAPCCVCGGMSITGIYFREREDVLLCGGRHDREVWGMWSCMTEPTP